MRLGVIADIRGNDVALRAILKDADQMALDRWWALGDLVLFGPRPAEVLDLLSTLPGIGMLRGNTDRYVLTGEQPAPHATVGDAVGSLDLVQRYVAMAAGIAWTRGVLDQAGKLATLASLPSQLRLQLPSGANVLGVHASPGADDGPGIEPEISEEHLRGLLAGSDADIIIGGHTHWITDGPAVTQRTIPFDADAVIDDLQGRHHPNTEFSTSVLSGQRRRVSKRSSS